MKTSLENQGIQNLLDEDDDPMYYLDKLAALGVKVEGPFQEGDAREQIQWIPF